MIIKTVDNYSQVSVEALVVSLFEDEKSHVDFVNKFVVEPKEFDGKYNTTYVLQTLGQFPVSKILVLGCGKRCDFDENKSRVLIAKAIKTLAGLKIKKVAFDLDQKLYEIVGVLHQEGFESERFDRVSNYLKVLERLIQSSEKEKAQDIIVQLNEEFKRESERT